MTTKLHLTSYGAVDDEDKPNEPAKLAEESERLSSDRFVIFVGVVQVIFLVCFWKSTTYDTDPDAAADFNNVLIYYIGISIMMLIGFGYLMTFLMYGGLSAVGFTFLITMLSVQMDILAEGFFQCVYDGEFATLHLSLNDIILGNCAAAACLISFGGLIGKAGMQCLAPFMLLETIFYAFSCQVISRYIGIADMGGTIKIHMFGAYFGLAASVALGIPSDEQQAAHANSNRSSDVFSLIGTVFLWIFWPCFNGAGAPMNSPMQQRIVLNTIFALTSCCVTTFVMSRIFFQKKFGPVDIQNATLAGGVMVGASCNYLLYPGGAIAIGMAAAWVSGIGYNVIMPNIQHLVHDSCGIHNLHGLPSVAGAIVSVILASKAKESDYAAEDYASAFPNGDNQWLQQLQGSLAVLIFSLSTGYITMLVCKKMFLQKAADKFSDREYWDIAYPVSPTLNASSPLDPLCL